MQKLMIIRRGKLNSASGNFTGFTSKKEKVFFPAKQVENWIGDLIDDEDQLIQGTVIYCVADSFDYQERDEDGEPKVDADGKPVMFTRLDSVASSTDKDKVYEVYNEEEILQEEAKSHLADSVKKFKLSKTSVKDLVGA